MNQKEIRELIDYLVEKDITDFELERGDVKLRVKRGATAEVQYVAAPTHVAPVTLAASTRRRPRSHSGRTARRPSP